MCKFDLLAWNKLSREDRKLDFTLLKSNMYILYFAKKKVYSF